MNPLPVFKNYVTSLISCIGLYLDTVVLSPISIYYVFQSKSPDAIFYILMYKIKGPLESWIKTEFDCTFDALFLCLPFPIVDIFGPYIEQKHSIQTLTNLLLKKMDLHIIGQSRVSQNTKKVLYLAYLKEKRQDKADEIFNLLLQKMPFLTQFLSNYKDHILDILEFEITKSAIITRFEFYPMLKRLFTKPHIQGCNFNGAPTAFDYCALNVTKEIPCKAQLIYSLFKCLV